MRNKVVTSQLRKEYDKCIPDRELHIFCVSNSEYWDHRDKSAQLALPYLRLSGILDLRRHCIGIVADSQLRVARIYLDNQLCELIGKVGLWVQSGAGTATAERKERVRQAVAEMEAVLKRVCRRRLPGYRSRY
jgi:hypothetical protein